MQTYVSILIFNLLSIVYLQLTVHESEVNKYKLFNVK